MEKGTGPFRTALSRRRNATVPADSLFPADAAAAGASAGNRLSGYYSLTYVSLPSFACLCKLLSSKASMTRKIPIINKA